uniref:RRM domain-containing protein n=1 Tax=Haptolina ericina TaxID=156174 RepID=A0A7S3B533_9EUKA
MARPSGYVAPANPPGLPIPALGGIVPPGAPPPPPPPPGPNGGMGLQPLGMGLQPLNNLGPAPGAPQPVVAPPAPPTVMPTSTLRLENLMTEAMLADDTEFKECVDDIKEECESYGKVAIFMIPRIGELQGRPESDAGVCFVKYEMITAAAKAYESLNGRDFDGNIVKATYLPAGSI